MPPRLLQRCEPDSIREFRLAARQRRLDALALQGEERRTGAIYLWGYVAEMTLKAAYFTLEGLDETTVITWPHHLSVAIERGRGMGITWPYAGAGHNIRAWAELLVRVRRLDATTRYPPRFARQVERHGVILGRLWSEILRYRKNIASESEVECVETSAQWFVDNFRLL